MFSNRSACSTIRSRSFRESRCFFSLAFKKVASFMMLAGRLRNTPAAFSSFPLAPIFSSLFGTILTSIGTQTLERASTRLRPGPVAVGTLDHRLAGHRNCGGPASDDRLRFKRSDQNSDRVKKDSLSLFLRRLLGRCLLGAALFAGLATGPVTAARGTTAWAAAAAWRITFSA